ncbi:MAG: prolyl aminopeptidase [Cyanobacteria bacterium HKST-UBA03]|nr:prolyl aminopeptidase [Cyanobacteria bacterium HKST-UBA03]
MTATPTPPVNLQVPTPPSQRLGLYPSIEPYQTHHVRVSSVHTLYVEEVGNPNGLPVVFLHGGPGGGISADHRRQFDPDLYRIILFDQRGSGKSTPHASLQDNTTWDLVADIEQLRKQLHIDQWLVFGGSWGSTLALAYAQTHPASVSGLILRGIFLCRPDEIQWFYQAGCHRLFPDVWQHYEAVVPPQERDDMLSAYYRRLTSDDEAVRLQAAKAWSVWEGSLCHLLPNQTTIDHFESPEAALALARIECHYFVHNCWFKKDNQLLADAHLLSAIPMWIVHGRYDVICPLENAWQLAQACPHAHLTIVPDAGHSFSEPGILDALIRATQAYAARFVPV